MQPTKKRTILSKESYSAKYSSKRKECYHGKQRTLQKNLTSNNPLLEGRPPDSCRRMKNSSSAPLELPCTRSYSPHHPAHASWTSAVTSPSQLAHAHKQLSSSELFQYNRRRLERGTRMTSSPTTARHPKQSCNLLHLKGPTFPSLTFSTLQYDDGTTPPTTAIFYQCQITRMVV